LSKNVAVFVDVANIFYAAKAAGVDIDYVTLLKASSAGRDLVRAYAYTGLDPDNENQRNFHDFLRRHGYKVVSKDIRKYGDGKVKANLDIELVVDMMKTARNLDIAIVVSGDGDFAPAIRAVQEMGVRVEVVSFRGNTSSDLIDVADIFTDITQIAKVEKGSGRSGRRVADDDEDLSMTEVPDKMTEGTGERRRRGGRSRSEGEGRAAAGGRRGSSRTAARDRDEERAPAHDRDGRDHADRDRDEAPGEGVLVALPGEKLSRAARTVPAPAAASAAVEDDDAFEDDDEAAAGGAENGEGEGDGDAPRRRRRRRGGRGRGRGRGREGAAGEGVPASNGDAGEVGDAGEFEELEELPPSPRKAASTFGSVWDSQLGVPAASSGARVTPEPIDEEDLEEPAIPEYLLAERRQRDARRGGRVQGGRGGRGGAYAAAMDRERFGGGRGSTPSRFAEPAQRREPRDFRDARGPQPSRSGGGRFDRPERSEARSSGGDPWSEVPPEIEAMLRAQLASGGGRSAAPTRPGSGERGSAPRRELAPRRTGSPDEPVANATQAAADATPEAAAPAPRRGRRATASADAGTADAAAAKAPARRRTTKAAATDVGAAPDAAVTAPAAKAPARRRTTKAIAADASSAPEAPATENGSGGDAAPKRRVTRRKADTAS
jgi:uncharacterized LabA/DUF88 family protein